LHNCNCCFQDGFKAEIDAVLLRQIVEARRQDLGLILSAVAGPDTDVESGTPSQSEVISQIKL